MFDNSKHRFRNSLRIFYFHKIKRVTDYTDLRGEKNEDSADIELFAAVITRY